MTMGLVLPAAKLNPLKQDAAAANLGRRPHRAYLQRSGVPAAAAGHHSRFSSEGFDIVLSSGFLAFASHAGFLQAVEDVGLPVRGIMGTSSGAMTGACYAAGLSPKEIAREFSRIPPIKRVRLARKPWRGVLSMKPAMEELRAMLPPTFEDLKRDFGVGVVGLGGSAAHQQYEFIDSGALPEAIVASASVPVLFSPVDIPGAQQSPYIDGGVSCRIGLNLWRENRGKGKADSHPNHAIVHLIGRSSPFSGNDSLQSIGKNVSVVCSPKSGASLWDLNGFDEQFEEARERALLVLRPLGAATAARAAVGDQGKAATV